MKIIIAGVGKVGSTLARQLSASGYDITLIDVKQQVLEANVEKYDVMAVLGNCATMETIQTSIQLQGFVLRIIQIRFTKCRKHLRCH